MKRAVPRNRYGVFLFIAAAVSTADLASKHWIFAANWMFPERGLDGRVWWLWENVFGFQRSLNLGALFGLGQGYWPLFAVLSVMAAVAIFVWLFGLGAGRDWLLTIALALVTAGILGNLYDRLALHGLGPDGLPASHGAHAVRDFLVMFQVGQWHWPNYNLADSALVSGVILLVWQALFAKHESEGQAADRETASPK